MRTGWRRTGARAAETTQARGKAATELAALMQSNPEVRKLLAASLEKARQVNPDRNSNPVHSVAEYLDFISWAETAMPWSLLEKKDHPDIYDDTFQSLVYFHFLVDQPLDELAGRARDAQVRYEEAASLAAEAGDAPGYRRWLSASKTLRASI